MAVAGPRSGEVLGQLQGRPVSDSLVPDLHSFLQRQADAFAGGFDGYRQSRERARGEMAVANGDHDVGTVGAVGGRHQGELLAGISRHLLAAQHGIITCST